MFFTRAFPHLAVSFRLQTRNEVRVSESFICALVRREVAADKVGEPTLIMHRTWKMKDGRWEAGYEGCEWQVYTHVERKTENRPFGVALLCVIGQG